MAFVIDFKNIIIRKWNNILNINANEILVNLSRGINRNIIYISYSHNMYINSEKKYIAYFFSFSLLSQCCLFMCTFCII